MRCLKYTRHMLNQLFKKQRWQEFLFTFLFYFLNLKIDNMLMCWRIIEIDNILFQYGYKTFVSLQLGTTDPSRVDLDTTGDDSVFVVDTLTVYGLMFLTDEHTEFANLEAFNLRQGKVMNGRMAYSIRVQFVNSPTAGQY